MADEVSPESPGSSVLGGPPRLAPVASVPRGLALAAGLAAGLAAFAIGEVFYEWIPAAKVPQSLGGSVVMQPSPATLAVADARNAALAFGVLGSCLGLALGMAGGGTGRRGMAAGAIGLALGGLLGAALPLTLVVPYLELQHWRFSDDLLVPLAMHGIFWGVLGAVGGLAYGIGAGSGKWRCALLGLVGAVLGALIYELLGVMIDPLEGTSDPISKTARTRLIARLAVALGAAGLIALAGAEPGAAGGPRPGRRRA